MKYNRPIDAALATARHLETQGRQAVDTAGIPVFITDTGETCGIGCHLDQTTLHELIEHGRNNWTAADITAITGTTDLLIPGLDATEMNRFWEAVRQVHDDLAYWTADGFAGTDELVAIGVEHSA